MTVRTTHRQMGSKARVAADLLRLVPRDVTVWVEAFAGTAAMTLASAPRPVEHVNDLNGDVVNLFRCLRDEDALRRLCRSVALTPWAMEEFEAARDEVWTSDAADAADPVERARRFLVASWQGIGGKQHPRASWRLDLGRSWLMGVWDGVPARLVAAAERLRSVHLHRRPVFDLIAQFGDREDAFLFLDPPYPRDTLATHETLYAIDMTADEHARLAALLPALRCRVLMTMASGTVYGPALAGWHARPLAVRGLRNSVKAEVVYMNYRPPVDAPAVQMPLIPELAP